MDTDCGRIAFNIKDKNSQTPHDHKKQQCANKYIPYESFLLLRSHLTRDSSNFAVHLSARGSRGVGPQAVTYDMDVSEPPPGLDQPLDDEPGLGGHHSGVGDGLVVVRGRSSRPPRHYDHVVVSLSTKFIIICL